MLLNSILARNFLHKQKPRRCHWICWYIPLLNTTLQYERKNIIDFHMYFNFDFTFFLVRVR